ncbi:phosphotransferase [Paenibacillus cremeus]|uniref:Aminoglycoside phosphotransferase family protein n=1 Tax=Paenibacillus cremeus TaxID=2163881 RepID=A0A559K341_9BACL|nr:phosphotransferase [Paenibacillus cremeus]TVY06561.1 aminoglycoside phosphotransferase family protein [Paenibacillus cremeus]
MREQKPLWRNVPIEIREKLAVMAGSPICRGLRIYGGYGPSATFRLFLKDGRTVFAKGAGKGSTPENWRVIPLEQVAYQKIEAVASISPAYLGSVIDKDWYLLLLEDLKGSIKVPPWTLNLAVKAVRDIARFHLRGIKEASKVEMIKSKGFNDNWIKIRNDREELNHLLTLFPGHEGQAESWINNNINQLVDMEAELLRTDQPWGLIHSDIRSDNLRFRNGELILFDWALVCAGPLILDVIFFFPSIAGEGGPTAEQLMPEYMNVMASEGIAFPSFAEKAAAAATAGFFATRAGKPAIPALPRLRQIQRLQLGPALRWAAKTLNLPKPPLLGVTD